MNIFSRILQGYHGAGIALTSGDKVLMQLRRHPRVWAFIGGGGKKGESHIETAIREFYEETGIALTADMLDEKPLHVLGFSRFKWVLYHCHVENMPSVTAGSDKFRKEYICYRYVTVSSYRKELSSENHRRTFFFVPYQMKVLNKRLSL